MDPTDRWNLHLLSCRYPGKSYYFHKASRTSQWTLPTTEEVQAAVTAGEASAVATAEAVAQAQAVAVAQAQGYRAGAVVAEAQAVGTA